MELKTVSLERFADILSDWSFSLTIDPVSCFYRKQPEDCLTDGRVIKTNEVNFIVEKKVQGTVGSGDVCALPGDFLLYTPQIPHSLLYPEGVWFYAFRFKIHKDGVFYTTDTPFTHLKNTWDINGYIRDIVMEMKADMPGKMKKVRLLVATLFFEINRKASRSPGLKAENRHLLNYSRQNIITQYLSKNVHRPINGKDLAKAVELSTTYFRLVFKNTYGISPRSWILNERIRHAAVRLLESNLTIGELAEEYGYSDIYLFSRQFKNVMGISPMKYRRQEVAEEVGEAE